MLMRNQIRVSTVLIVILTASSAVPAKDKKQQEAEALLAKARELHDIRCDGCKPFRLKAEIRSYEDAGKTVDGTYVLYWASKDKWRDEITWPDYNEAQVCLGDKIWRRHSSRFRPRSAGWVLGQLNLGAHLEKVINTRINEVIVKDLSSGSSICAAFTSGGVSLLDLRCFLRDSAHLVHEETPFETLDYHEHVPFAGRIYPRRILQFAKGSLSREIRVKELQVSQEWATGLFEPLTGPDVRETCREPELPRLVAPKTPALPSNMLGDFKAHIEVNVGSDGSAQIDRIYVSDVRIAPYVRTAVSEWRYAPAKCGSKPIDAELSTELNIHHQH